MLFHPGKPAEPGHARLWLAMCCVLVALAKGLFFSSYEMWPPRERPFPVNVFELAVSMFAIWLIGTTVRKRMKKPSPASSFIAPSIIGVLALGTAALAVTVGIQHDQWVREMSGHIMQMLDEDVKKLEADRRDVH